MTHAMLFTGVDLINNKPQKWRVENSWGNKNGDNGYYLMSDSWFDEYNYEVVIDKKYLNSKQTIMKFIDETIILVKAGNGGDGSPSFRREKFIEFGGPDGGDGGKGGSIILRSERNLNTLIDYRFQQHHKAERGENGSGQNRTGRSGENLFLKVPIGTQVFEEDNKTLIYDFKKENEHPITGSEVSGPEFGDSNLFLGKWCYIV